MPKSLFSIKGLLTGIALSLAVGLLAPYGVVFNYYWVGFNPSSPGALFLFFVLTFAVNGFVALLGRHFALSKADLVLIYCMLMMAVTVPTWGLMFFLIGTIVYPFYYATPGKRLRRVVLRLYPFVDCAAGLRGHQELLRGPAEG